MSLGLSVGPECATSHGQQVDGAGDTDEDKAEAVERVRKPKTAKQ